MALVRLALALCAAASASASPAASASSGSGAFEVVLGLPLRRLQQLEALFWRVSDPEDAEEYLQHRSVDQLAELVAPDPEAVSAARQWLRELGAAEVRFEALNGRLTAKFASDAERRLTEQWSERGIPQREHFGRPVDFIYRRDARAPPTLDAEQRAHADLPGRYTIAQQKEAIGMPPDLQASHPDTLQMVWGPGTFGYSKTQLALFKKEQCPLLALDKVHTDGFAGKTGGDNCTRATRPAAAPRMCSRVVDRARFCVRRSRRGQPGRADDLQLRPERHDARHQHQHLHVNRGGRGLRPRHARLRHLPGLPRQAAREPKHTCRFRPRKDVSEPSTAKRLGHSKSSRSRSARSRPTPATCSARRRCRSTARTLRSARPSCRSSGRCACSRTPPRSTASTSCVPPLHAHIPAGSPILSLSEAEAEAEAQSRHLIADSTSPDLRTFC